jgi:hypothetical protein
MPHAPSANVPPFVWSPGRGCDEAALARLRAAFPRPAKPMGEAWFMGAERHLFSNLMGDIRSVPVADLFAPLFEIASGTGSFGPYREWRDWLDYLLPRLTPRAHEQYAASLVEPLISAFITQYPDGAVTEPYPGFRHDALRTLGQCLMEPHCWADGRVALGAMLHRYRNPNVGVWFWYDASRDFSASMFFCLKLLAADEIRPWLTSVLQIACPHWRAQVIVWFVGAYGLLTGEQLQVSELDTVTRPSMVWEHSHCLHGDYAGHAPDAPPAPPFLTVETRSEVLRVLKATITPDRYLEWLMSIADYDYLEAELAELPDRFVELYMAGGA